MAPSQRKPTGSGRPASALPFRRIIVPSLLFLILAILVQGCSTRASRPDRETTDRVISAVESTFMAMQDRDYAGVWWHLSSASRSAIVAETRKAIEGKGDGEAPSSESIAEDFREGGPIARAYWSGFLRRFDPETALSESVWEMGDAGPAQARVFITHERADRPAVIRLYLEDGVWKVGLWETFRNQPVR